MMRRGMTELTGADSWADAWRLFFEPGDVVGIKLNPVGQPLVKSDATVLHEIIAGLKQVFQTQQPVVIYPASGTGAWEAALVNACSPGDSVLMVETGQFASLWQKMAGKVGLQVVTMAKDRRPGADPAAVGLAHETIYWTPPEGARLRDANYLE